MKIKELIERIDVEAVIQDDKLCHSGFRDVIYELQLDDRVGWGENVKQDRLFGAFVRVHYCTDTWVGLRVYVFDKEVVAFSAQPGRKSDLKFSWVSREAYNKVKSFCESFAEPQEDNILVIDDGVEIGEGYRIEFSGQLIPHIHTTARFGKDIVSVLRDANPRDIISDMVTIRYPDGTVGDVKVGCLIFPELLLKEGLV